MVKIYTSTYNYKGNDRLDITVKGQDPFGKYFAPTWDMVMKYKKDRDKISYMKSYHKLMIDFYLQSKIIWDAILEMDTITLVCFCKPGFCHRFLLKDYLVKLGGEYMGEI